MLTDSELQLNRIAQGLVKESEGILWFEGLLPVQRQQVLIDLARMCDQSHPRNDEVSKAIAYAQLKPTFTPCILLKSANPPEKGLYKIIALPESEQIKSFRLLIALFAISDARRREAHCKDGCSHEWHNLDSL
ncbi:DUF5958 family protein [Acaryochloris sp. CCMEE 5410]|uniref:DUF5958 family protein n=1 Tax=Acaryochloris sp. CCMEE 5410 TaxID=310037 RepID=UPI0002484F48|nr:DUF5958 family protein [Acaryochloris sp. CCMEE 5410]KAI9129574.1 hypothetical protein ON05_033245 [Acaryochloris sp. CCMEE 5410]